MNKYDGTVNYHDRDSDQRIGMCEKDDMEYKSRRKTKNHGTSQKNREAVK